jgi:hypothetical protein
MKIEQFSFGRIRIDGSEYEHDVVIDRGRISKRDKKPSKRYSERYAHTPLSAKEDLPWHCRRLIIGTGAYGALPVMAEVEREAASRAVELCVLPTAQALEKVNEGDPATNAILHVTC